MGVLKLPENVRKGLVIQQQYDEKAGLATLFSYKGTAMEMVLKSPRFWFLVLLHLTLWLVKKFQCKPPEECGETTAFRDIIMKTYSVQFGVMIALTDTKPAIDFAALTGLTTFLVVFYNGNCFGRYNSMYAECIAMQGKLHNMSLYLRAYYTSAGTRWNVIRYPLASHFIFYWSLQRRYFDWSKSQFKGMDPGTFDDLIDKTLLPKGVLIAKEAHCLKKYAGNKHKLLFTWSIIALKRIMQLPLESGGEGGNVNLQSVTEQTALISALKEEIVEMRGAIGKIDNSMLFPIPFQYFHVVNMVLTLNLLLMNFAFLGLPDEDGSFMWSMICYTLICFTLLGLLEVANAMADPFGKDDCDFNQHAVLNGIYHDCKKLCEEPDEAFLQEIGNPKFNPKLNADGTFEEVDPGADEDEGEEQEPMWAESDVSALVNEKEEVEAKLRVHELSKLEKTINELGVAMERLTKMQEKTSSVHVHLVDGVEALKSDLAHQTAEVTRLEELTSTQMQRVNRLERLQAHRLAATVALPVPKLPPFGLALEITTDYQGKTVCQVADLLRGSPADTGMMTHGDVLTSVDGDKLVGDQITPINVKDLLQQKTWNDTVSFGVIRDGEKKVLHIWRGGLTGPDGNVRPMPTAPQGSGVRGAPSSATPAPGTEMVMGAASSSTVVVPRSVEAAPGKEGSVSATSPGTGGSAQKFISFESPGPG